MISITWSLHNDKCRIVFVIIYLKKVKTQVYLFWLWFWAVRKALPLSTLFIMLLVEAAFDRRLRFSFSLAKTTSEVFVLVAFIG